jgi:Ribonuclease G/E
VARISRFSLIEMTRQRVRESLKRTTYKPCQHCTGTGYVKSVESAALEVLREVQLRLVEHPSDPVTVVCHPDVADYLRKRKLPAIEKLKERFKQPVEVVASRDLRADEIKFN